MTFFDLNDDVKTIIANCTSDYFISTMSILDKHEDLQKKLFGEKFFTFMRNVRVFFNLKLRKIVIAPRTDALNLLIIYLVKILH